MLYIYIYHDNCILITKNKGCKKKIVTDLERGLYVEILIQNVNNISADLQKKKSIFFFHRTLFILDHDVI